MKLCRNSAASALIAVIVTFGWFSFSPRAVADVTLFAEHGWRVDGVEDSAVAHVIHVSVGKNLLGTFRELKVYFSPDTNAQPQICSFTADRIRPQLPGGPAGGAFALSSYWECTTGYVPPLEIQSLKIRTRRKKGAHQLELTGTASNLTSLATSKLAFLINTPTTSEVAIAVDYRLRATREICLNDTNIALGYGFNTANIISSYLSAETNANDVVRYNALVSKNCIPIGIGQKCIKHTVLHCFPLTNTNAQVISETFKMNSTKLWLLHTTPSPDNTPSLIVEFLHPAPGYHRPQAMTMLATEPGTENVLVWGSWRQAKTFYKARKNLGRFKYNLFAIPPGPLPCES